MNATMSALSWSLIGGVGDQLEESLVVVEDLFKCPRAIVVEIRGLVFDAPERRDFEIENLVGVARDSRPPQVRGNEHERRTVFEKTDLDFITLSFLVGRVSPLPSGVWIDHRAQKVGLSIEQDGHG
jgi:hypothetical protein